MDNGKILANALKQDESIKYRAYIKKNIFEMANFYFAFIFITVIVLDLLKFTCLISSWNIVNNIINIILYCFIVYLLIKDIIQQINTSITIITDGIIIKSAQNTIYLPRKDIMFIDKNKIICNHKQYNLYYVSDFRTFREKFLETLTNQEKQELIQKGQEFYLKQKLLNLIQKNTSLIKSILSVLCIIFIIFLISKFYV